MSEMQRIKALEYEEVVKAKRRQSDEEGAERAIES